LDIDFLSFECIVRKSKIDESFNFPLRQFIDKSTELISYIRNCSITLLICIEYKQNIIKKVNDMLRLYIMF
jgi:hypothetical protein